MVNFNDFISNIIILLCDNKKEIHFTFVKYLCFAMNEKQKLLLATCSLGIPIINSW